MNARHYDGARVLLKLVLFLTLAVFTYDIPPTRLDEAHLSALEKNIAQTADSWLGALAKPTDLELANACESFDRTAKTYGLDYDPLTHLIQYQGVARYPEIYQSTFLAHEYGHVIFRANIALVSPQIQSDLAGSIQYRQLLREELNQVSPTQCERPTEQDSPALQAARKALTGGDYFTFDALKLGAYDELFADIVAVLFTKNPDAVYNAVGGAQVNWSNKYSITVPPGYRGRDFTYQLPIKGWRQDHPVISFYDFLGAEMDFYNVLDPARGYLWEHYLRALTKDQYAKFIQGYLQAVGVQYTRFVQEQIWDEPVEDMNTRFIEEIDRQMAALGVRKL